jgi:hypothetical protein
VPLTYTLVSQPKMSTGMKFVYADALTRAIECSSATEEEKQRMLKLYEETREGRELAEEEAHREGQKDAVEDLFSGWEFEPTLDDLANRSPPMSKEVNGEMMYRYPMKEEGEAIYYSGQVIKFPVRWDMGERKYELRQIPAKEWKAGKRWTLGRVWETACVVYSKNKKRAVKEMGDHHFWEGICETDGVVYVGS